jgi:pimeloyl-ACP methyl ester carboxylesterase
MADVGDGTGRAGWCIFYRHRARGEDMPHFTAADGTRLAYEDYGSGDPILFVGGVMLSADMWEYQIPYFVEQGYRCVTLDWRGHGRSDRASGGYDFATIADDLAALVEQLDLRDLFVVGHSMGGAGAAEYVAAHGAGRVRGIAFVAAMMPFLKQTDDNPAGVPEPLFDAAFQALRTDRLKWLSDQSQVFFATHLGRAVSPYLVQHTISECAAAAPYAVLAYQRAVFHTDHRPALAALNVPALIVHGAADFSAPVDVTGRRSAELIPHAEYREYPDAGHGVYASHHDQLNADLLEFVKNSVATAPGQQRGGR